MPLTPTWSSAAMTRVGTLHGSEGLTVWICTLASSLRPIPRTAPPSAVLRPDGQMAATGLVGSTKSVVGQLRLFVPPLDRWEACFAFQSALARPDPDRLRRGIVSPPLKEIPRTATRGLPPEAARAAGLDPSLHLGRPVSAAPSAAAAVRRRRSRITSSPLPRAQTWVKRSPTSRPTVMAGPSLHSMLRVVAISCCMARVLPRQGSSEPLPGLSRPLFRGTMSPLRRRAVAS